MANALYRKYRPLVFDDVIGQQHIVGTLKNQIKHSRISHAYLFTGSRGTGKTTCAKIFARAINCRNPSDGSPCGQCDCCKALSQSNNIDVLEIDAASNNGVDDAREIRERVKYPPVYGKYKVYIIDEVHMLSAPAFNALLKTLEEPPAHAVFILATTEAHKLPATILSRCMRFDFRLVGLQPLTELLKKIFEAEGKPCEEDALKFIARAGEGSVRDMLSVADICYSYSDGRLTLTDVMEVTGNADRGAVHALFDAVRRSDLSAVFSRLDEMASAGKSMSLIAKELTRYSRDLLVVKTGNTRLIIDTEEKIAAMSDYCKSCEVSELTAFINAFSAIDSELRYSVSPRIVLEAACIRAAKLAAADLSALEARIARLESGAPIAPRSLPPEQAAPPTPPAGKPAAPQIGAAAAGAPRDAIAVWGRVITYLRKNESMRIFTLAGSLGDVEITDGQLTVWADDDTFLQLSEPEVTEALQRALDADGAGLKIAVDKRRQVDNDKIVDRLKSLMGDARLEIKKTRGK